MLKLFIIRVAFFKNATFYPGAFMQREARLLIMNN